MAVRVGNSPSATPCCSASKFLSSNRTQLEGDKQGKVTPEPSLRLHPPGTLSAQCRELELPLIKERSTVDAAAGTRVRRKKGLKWSKGERKEGIEIKGWARQCRFFNPSTQESRGRQTLVSLKLEP